MFEVIVLVLIIAMHITVYDCMSQDPRFNKAVDIFTGYQTKSILCMPIQSPDGEVRSLEYLHVKIRTTVYAVPTKLLCKSTPKQLITEMVSAAIAS